MTLKEQYKQLLLEHGLECGRSVNTKDWWTKGGLHELRFPENGFTHVKRKGGESGVLVIEHYPNGSLRQLELVIFDNRLNKEGSKRQHAGFAIPNTLGITVKAPKKRPAKRVVVMAV